MEDVRNSSLQREWHDLNELGAPFVYKLKGVCKWFFQHPSLDQRLVDERKLRVYNPMRNRLEPRIAGYVGGIALPRGAIEISIAPFYFRVAEEEIFGPDLRTKTTMYELFQQKDQDFMGLMTTKVKPLRGLELFDPQFPVPIAPDQVLEVAMKHYSDFSVWFGTNID